jgi:hypothetical protein
MCGGAAEGVFGGGAEGTSGLGVGVWFQQSASFSDGLTGWLF